MVSFCGLGDATILPVPLSASMPCKKDDTKPMHLDLSFWWNSKIIQNSHSYRFRLGELQNPGAFLWSKWIKFEKKSVCPSALVMAHVDSIWCVDLTVPSLLRPGAATRIFGPRFLQHLYLHIISSPARCGSPLLDDFCLSLKSVPTKFENIKLFHILTLQHASRSTFALGNPKVGIIASIPVWLFQVQVLLIIVYLLPKSLGCHRLRRSLKRQMHPSLHTLRDRAFTGLSQKQESVHYSIWTFYLFI